MSDANPRAREAELFRSLADALDRGDTETAASVCRLLANTVAPADALPVTPAPKPGKRRPNTGT